MEKVNNRQGGEAQVNYVQVVELTEEEKRKIYRKMKKEELIDMLIARDKYYVPREPDYEPYTDMCSDFSFSHASKSTAGQCDGETEEFVWDNQTPWGDGYYSTSTIPDLVL